MQNTTHSSTQQRLALEIIDIETRKLAAINMDPTVDDARYETEKPILERLSQWNTVLGDPRQDEIPMQRLPQTIGNQLKAAFVIALGVAAGIVFVFVLLSQMGQIERGTPMEHQENSRPVELYG